MIERYQLDGGTVPALPCPHDCVIRRIAFDDDFIVFYFEHQIHRRDSVSQRHPECDTLIMRYHLFDPEFCTYRQIRHLTRLGARLGRRGYYEIQNKTLLRRSRYPLEFLYQRAARRSVLITLWRGEFILINAEVDWAEYEWID